MSRNMTILFWGALWGILEASLGWFLHLIHFKGEVLILYPFGLMCMLLAAKQTAKTSSVLKVAGVASVIKLVNLFMYPAVPFYHVVNPAVAIFLEGLVTFVFCVSVQRGISFKKAGIPLAVFLVFVSIFIFRGWQIIMDTYVSYNPSVHKPFDLALISQWIERSLIQGLMIVGVFYLVRFVTFNTLSNKWISRLSIPLVCLAVLLNIFI